MKTYCLDSNVLIQAWSKYYSFELCPDYWELLSELGKSGKIFICRNVYDEIAKVEDQLFKWLKSSHIPVKEITLEVTAALNAIYKAKDYHKLLVDNTKQRSLADPWVIAHALHEGATVVTKEELTFGSTKRPKIPDVCKNMEIDCINDFNFLKAIGVYFSCYRL